MPKYRVQLSDGRIVTVEGNQPPTEDQILAQLGPAQSAQPAAEPESSWTDTAIDALPTIGGTVGSFAGGGKWNPLGMAGAALGGTAGEAIKQTANAVRGRMDLVPRSAGEQLKSMMAAGAVQGGIEGVGRGVGKGLKALAPKLADVALSPIESVTRKYPNIGQTYVQEAKLFPALRGGVGPVGQKASTDTARGLMKGSRASGDAMITTADAAGAPAVSGRKVISELRPIYDEATKLARTGKADTRPAILARAKSFTRQNRAIPNVDANDLRRSLDTAADKAFEAERKMGPPAGIEAQMDKALAGGLRTGVRANVPGSQAISQRTSELMGLTKALGKAQTRKSLLTRNMGIATGIGGGAAGALGSGGDPSATLASGAGTLGAAYLMTNPRNIGRMALASHGAGRVADVTPQMIRAAILAQLASSEPDN